MELGRTGMWACGASIVAMATFTGASASAQRLPDSARPSALDTVPVSEEETIVVTGSRLSASGFTAPTPVTVIGQEELQRQGAVNIADALNRLPAFRAQSTPATTAIFVSNAGANLADLRGLGANRSLVLVDGRRFVPGTTAGGGFSPSGAVDLNMIPAILVRRTEVVTGGASANYGSDAVAGVINLILDTSFEGIRGSAQAGISGLGDNREIYATLAAGTSFAGGRGSIVVGGEYSDSAGTGDCYTRDWCAVSYNAISNPLPQVNGLARRIILPDTRSLATRGGIVLNGPLMGLAFDANGTPYQADFGTFYGVGIFQAGGSIDPVNSFYNNFPLVSPVERYSILGNAGYDFTDSLRGFVELSHAHVLGTTIGAAPRFIAGQLQIRTDNAFLPDSVRARMAQAGVAQINLGRIGEDFGPQLGRVTRDTWRIATGFSGSLGPSFEWDGYYQYGRTDYHQLGSNVAIIGNGTPFSGNFQNAVDAVDEGLFRNGVANGNIVCRATLTNPDHPYVQGCRPINIFGERQFDQAGKDYAFGDAVQETALKQHVAALNLRGNLFDLPGGPFAVATGFEYRVEDVNGTADPISSELRFFTSPGSAISGPAVKVKEGYFEAAAPLLADQPFFRSLSLNGAVRLTDYSTTGTVTTWKAGAIWEPSSFLRLRGTRSRDIRAPNFFELNNPTTTSYSSVTDPLNNQQAFLTAFLNSGNSELQPEVADTLTVGGVITPFRNLRIAADFYDITLDGAIGTLGPQAIVNRCAAGTAELCDFIVRDENNILVSIRNPFLNINRIITRGIDIEASYNSRLGAGDLSVRLLGTHVLDLITIDPAGVAVNRAGQNGAPLGAPVGVPHFIGNAFLNYRLDAVTLGVDFRYVSPGIYDATLIGPHQDGYDPVAPNSISNNRVGSRFYVNFNFSVDVARGERGRMQFFGVVNNLLDQDPPNQMPSSFTSTSPQFYDVIGRAFRVGVRFEN